MNEQATKKVVESIEINNNVIGCDCDSWKKSWPYIERAQLSYHSIDNPYKGDVFNYCPWCGEKTKLVNK